MVMTARSRGYARGLTAISSAHRAAPRPGDQAI